MKALGESEFSVLELRMSACSTGKWSGQERRAVEVGGIFIGLSQESSRWAQIQIPNNIQLGLCEKWGLSRVGPDNVRLEVFVCGWIGKDLESLNSIIFTSSNTPLLIVQYSYTQET
jgi:hypothetical protein